LGMAIVEGLLKGFDTGETSKEEDFGIGINNRLEGVQEPLVRLLVTRPPRR